MNIFLKVLKANIPGINLSAFLINSKSLEFKHNKHSIFYKLFHRKFVTATFSSKSHEANKKNTITFYLDDIDDSIYHEFLHMASTRETEDDYFSGFFQANYNDQVFAIGRGLNEGYTDVFN